MFNRKTTAEATGPRYLEPLNRVPSLVELQKQCENASKTKPREIILSWYLQSGESKDLPPSYAIGVLYPREPYDAQPRWSFYEVLPDQLRTHWSYETADASLIHNMILCALPDQALAPELDGSYAYRSSLERSEAEGGEREGAAESGSQPIDYGLPELPVVDLPKTYASFGAESAFMGGEQETVSPSALSTSVPLSATAPAPAAVPAPSNSPAKDSALVDSSILPTVAAAAAAQRTTPRRAAVAPRTDLQKEFGYLVAPGEIDALEKLIYNPTTGLLSGAACAYNLKNAFVRGRICGGSFAIIVMRLRTASGADVDLDKASERIGVIREIVRPCDLLYQIDNYGFIVILPEVSTEMLNSYIKDFMARLSSRNRTSSGSSDSSGSGSNTGASKGASAARSERMFVKIGSATAPHDGMTSEDIFKCAMSKDRSVIATF